MKLLLAFALLLQDPDWKKANFAEPPPPEEFQSTGKHLEIVNILGSLRGKHSNEVGAVAFSPDGKRALSSDAREIRVWEVPSGRLVRTLRIGGARFLLFPDGKRILTATMEKIATFDLESGESLATWQTQGVLGFNLLALSPDGTMALTDHSSAGVVLWDAVGGIPTARWDALGKGKIMSALFHSDGTRAIFADREGSIRVWDVAQGKERASWKADSQAIAGMALHPDGTTILVCSKSGVTLWNVDSSKSAGSWEVRFGWGASVAFSPDGARALVGTDQGSVLLYNAANGKALTAWTAGLKRVPSVAFSLDGRHAIAGCGLRIRIWDTKSQEELFTSSGHDLPVRSVEFSRNGQAILAIDDGRYHVWDPATGRELDVGYGSDRMTFLSPNGKSLLFTSGASLSFRKLGEPPVPWQGKVDAPIQGVVSSPDGTLAATVSGDRTITIWETSSGVAKKSWTGSTKGCELLSFSPDGSLLATYDWEKCCTFWETESGKMRSSCAFEGTVIRSAWSPDGKRLVVGGYQGVFHLFDAAQGKEIKKWGDFRSNGDISGLCFSPDGKYVVASSAAWRQIALWDPELECPVDAIDAQGIPNSLALHGDLLAAANTDSTATLYRVRDYPKPGEGIRVRAGLWLERGDAMKAFADYGEALRINPEDASAYLGRGFARARSGDMETALADLTRAIELDPKAAEAYYYRGAVRYREKKWKEAAADFTLALERDPKHENALYYRVRCYWTLENREGALGDVERLVALRPARLEYLEYRARIRSSKGDVDGTLTDLARILELHPGRAEAYAMRGYIRADRESWKEALDDFRLYGRFVSDGDSGTVPLRIWLIRSRLAEAEKATEDLREYAKGRRGDWNAQIASCLLGECTGEELLRIAGTDKDRLCEAHYFLGAKSLLEGNAAGARDCFRKCVETGQEFLPEYRSAVEELRRLDK